MEVRFLGHAAFELSDGETTVLLDPWLSDNPKAAVSPDEVSPAAILLTHGHGDHFGDTEAIAKRTGAPIVAMVEIARELAEAGFETHEPNMGGTVKFDWGWVRMVPAWHSSSTPKGTASNAAGLVVSIGGKVVYHAGDTCAFTDMQLIGKRTPIDIALLPIGGHYTMDREEAVDAVEWVAPQTVIPCHYNTFPLVETDVEAFKSDVETSTSANVVILEPGESHTA